jgi:putative lipoic acid-binding regulatory protein
VTVVTDESLLEFPCDFPIKIMGRESSEFHVLARELVEKHAGPLADEAVVHALSRKGNFVSVTVTVIAESQQQLDDIYRELTAHDDVLMAL